MNDGLWIRRGVGTVIALLGMACARRDPPVPATGSVDTAGPGSASGAMAAQATPTGPLGFDSIPFGMSLGQWKGAHPADSLLVLRVGSRPVIAEWRGIPLVRPLCARATRVIGIARGLTLRRRVEFKLVPPDTGLPDPLAKKDELVLQHCVVTLIGYDASRDTVEANAHYDSPRLFDSLDGEWRSRARGRVAGDPDWSIPGLVGATSDSLLFGRFESDEYEEAAQSCFEGLIYEPDGPGQHCAAIYLMDGHHRAYQPGLTADRPLPEGSWKSGEFLLRSATGLDAVTRATAESLVLAPPARSTGTVDTSVVRALEAVRLVAEHGGPAVSAPDFALLDLLTARALQAGKLGDLEAGDSASSVPAILQSLGVPRIWEGFSGYWVYDHHFMARADSLAPEGELGDSVYAWLRQGQSGCTTDVSQDFAERLGGQRKYTQSPRPVRQRVHAMITMVRLWSDSLQGDGGADVAPVLDSIRSTLARALQLEEDPTARSRIREALWLAAANLRPLARRDNCTVDD